MEIEKNTLPKKSKEEMIRKEVYEALLEKKRNIATELISDHIERQTKIYTTKDDIKTEMWIYEDGIYIPQGKSFVKEITRDILGKAYTPHLYNTIVSKIEADTFIDADTFFKGNGSKYEQPVINGILNIKTKELSPFTDKKIFFNKIPVEYNENKDCPNIKKFFGDILKKGDEQIIYELLGFSMIKEYLFEKCFMFVGVGRNGKGKTLSLVRKFLGVENCVGVPLNQMKSDSSFLCELHNKLVNIPGDLSKFDFKDTGVFKLLTGRDLVQAKRKYLRDLTFENYAKMVFSCNELPRVYDNSEGFWDRWILIEFPYKFMTKQEIEKLPEEDRKKKKVKDETIVEKIATPDELSGLLNEALKGLERIFKNKGFSYTKGSNEVKEMWIRKSDSFRAFCMDCLESDEEEFLTKKEVRKKFQKYCKAHGIKGTSDKDIKITLEDLFGVIEERKVIHQGDYDRARVWEGVKFKEGAEVYWKRRVSTDIKDKQVLKTLGVMTEQFGKMHSLNLIIQYVPLEDKELKDSLGRLKRAGEVFSPKEGFYQLM